LPGCSFDHSGVGIRDSSIERRKRESK